MLVAWRCGYRLPLALCLFTLRVRARGGVRQEQEVVMTKRRCDRIYSVKDRRELWLWRVRVRAWRRAARRLRTRVSARRVRAACVLVRRSDWS